MNTKEKKTVGTMIHLYCNAKHGTTNALCAPCAELNKYAQKRLSKCVYGEDKPTCQKCPVHCYSSEMRNRIKEVMAYSGPRMIFHKPALALSHLIKEMKPVKVKSISTEKSL